MPKFKVKVWRNVYFSGSFEIEAKTEKDAENIAQEMDRHRQFEDNPNIIWNDGETEGYEFNCLEPISESDYPDKAA